MSVMIKESSMTTEEDRREAIDRARLHRLSTGKAKFCPKCSASLAGGTRRCSCCLTILSE